MALIIKNFIPASLDFALFVNAARATNGMVVSSKAMKMVISSVAAPNSIIPVAENSISA